VAWSRLSKSGNGLLVSFWHPLKIHLA
jgi:hypothetical protein